MQKPKIKRIIYHKTGNPSEDERERYVIPTSSFDTIRTLDVTDLEEGERADVAEKYKQYQEDCRAVVLNEIGTFDDWLDSETPLKWRNFKLDKIEMFD